MFGEHDLATASRIAKEKTEELGKNCVVVPTDNGKFTIGIEIPIHRGDFLRDLIESKIKKNEGSD